MPDNSLFECRNCPNCGRNDFIVLFDSNIAEIGYQENIESYTQWHRYGRHVKCKNCHLIYVNPIEKESRISKGYSERGDIDASINRRSRLNATKSQLQLVKKYREGGKLLDIGCAEGFFLFNAARAGFITKGIELSEDAATYAREEFSIDVETKSLEKLQFPQDYFDVVTLWQVLEHLPYPLRTLKEVYRILKPGGVVVVLTPNIEGIPAKVFRRKWWNLRRQHINQFSSRTLIAILENAGFKDASAASYRESTSLLMLFVALLRYLKVYKWLKSPFHPGSIPGRVMDKVMLTLPSSSKLDLCTAVGFK